MEKFEANRTYLEKNRQLYEQVYDVWSFGKLAEDRLQKLIDRLETREDELMEKPAPEKLPERVEEKYKKIFSTISEMVEAAKTEEELSKVEEKIKEVPLPESMKEQLTTKVEGKRGEITPEKPEVPPEAQPEIERILDYLRVQRDLGQPMHFMIERDINNLEELGYPEEKVEEVKRWFT